MGHLRTGYDQVRWVVEKDQDDLALTGVEDLEQKKVWEVVVVDIIPAAVEGNDLLVNKEKKVMKIRVRIMKDGDLPVDPERKKKKVLVRYRPAAIRECRTAATNALALMMTR